MSFLDIPKFKVDDKVDEILDLASGSPATKKVKYRKGMPIHLSCIRVKEGWNKRKIEKALLRPQMRTLIISAATDGIRQPLDVYAPKPRSEDQRLVLIAGHRRLYAMAACAVLQLRPIEECLLPVTIVKCPKKFYDQEYEHTMIRFVENASQDPLTSVEQAFECDSMLFTMTNEKNPKAISRKEAKKEIAMLKGLSVRCVDRYLKLLSLPTEILEMVDEGIIPIDVGEKLAGFDPEEMIVRAGDFVSHGRSAAFLNGAPMRKKKKKTQSVEIKQVEEIIMPKEDDGVVLSQSDAFEDVYEEEQDDEIEDDDAVLEHEEPRSVIRFKRSPEAVMAFVSRAEENGFQLLANALRWVLGTTNYSMEDIIFDADAKRREVEELQEALDKTDETVVQEV